jgi:hypothetical protein
MHTIHMLANRLLNVLSHPFFIGLLITAAIVLVAPPLFSRYRVREISHEFILGNSFYFYEDIDQDQFSEKFHLDLNHSHLIKIQLFKGSQVVSQSNLNNRPAAGEFLYFDDYNNDRIKDLFAFTFRNDSVFLNILNLLSDDPYIRKDRYIDLQETGSDEWEVPQIAPLGLTDYTQDGYREFVFNINTGFNKQPRNVYIYNVQEDTLLKSPESGASVFLPHLFDLNGDQVPEIVFGTLAVGNLDPEFPYSDQFGWLMALDKNLDFYFDPVPFEKYPCRVSVVPLSLSNGNRIIALNDYFGDDSLSSNLSIFNEKGDLIREIGLGGYKGGQAHILPAQLDRFYMLGNHSSVIELRDSTLNVIREMRGPDLYSNVPLFSFDADDDGVKEYLFKGNQTGLYYLVRNDFSSFTAFHVPSEVNQWHYSISRILRGDKVPYLYVPLNKGGITLEYTRNPLYQLRILIFCMAYLAISGLIFLVFLLQRYRAGLHFETKRRINELQLKSVKSQMDPHFTFNILNSIGSLYSNSKNRETADYLFGKYARMLRDTILSSDQTEVSLKQEIEFVRNYLDIEKFRLGKEFNYTIKIDEHVDMEVKIPRMLIHTFAENAVKYAIRQVESNGLLTIGIMKTSGELHITVADNGPGMHAAKKNNMAGTGKGLAIMDEMIRLFYDLKKVRISYSLENITKEGVCMGTRAEISVSG